MCDESDVLIKRYIFIKKIFSFNFRLQQVRKSVILFNYYEFLLYFVEIINSNYLYIRSIVEISSLSTIRIAAIVNLRLI